MDRPRPWSRTSAQSELGLYDSAVSTSQAVTSLSVRGEARRTTAPDEAQVFASIKSTAGSKAVALSDVHSVVSGILAALAQLGGTVLTADSTRAALTWSAHSMQTHEEQDHDKTTGRSGPTGRHLALVSVTIVVRDFSLLPGVTSAVTGRDAVEVHSVSWSVDEDNPQWALVRADAIHAALLKGQDYAAALGGTVVSVDHVADAGLLGGDNQGGGRPWSGSSVRGASGGGLGGVVAELSLDPDPQVLSTTIEARFTAEVGALPTR